LLERNTSRDSRDCCRKDMTLASNILALEQKRPLLAQPDLEQICPGQHILMYRYIQGRRDYYIIVQGNTGCYRIDMSRGSTGCFRKKDIQFEGKIRQLSGEFFTVDACSYPAVMDQ
jgi:hypothetical protein